MASSKSPSASKAKVVPNHGGVSKEFCFGKTPAITLEVVVMPSTRKD